MTSVSYPPLFDELDDLYEKVLQGFSLSPVSPDPPTPSDFTNHSAGPPSISAAQSSGSTIQRTPSYTPSVLSQTNSLPPNGPSPARRRPLPQPPGGAASIIPTPPAVPTPPPPPQPPALPPQVLPPVRQPSTSRPGPSYLSPTTHAQRRLSRKISRRYPAPSSRTAAPESPDDNGAGPSGTYEWDEDDEIATSPTTEFPDHYGAYLPSYYGSAAEDPIASLSLGYGPPAEGPNVDYTDPPPPALLDEPAVREPTSPTHYLAPARYNASASTHATAGLTESYNSSPAVSTFTSGDYPMLRPPSDSSFHLPDSIHDESGSLRNSEDWAGHIVEVTVNATRKATQDSYDAAMNEWAAGPSDLSRRNTNVIQLIANFDQRTHLELHAEDDDDFYEDDERRFINSCLLSNMAVQLRDNVPRGTHVKGSIPYPRAFTGRDIVSTLHALIQRELVRDLRGSQTDRRAALLVARSLQEMLFFYEVEWGARVLQDGVEDVYMFLDDQDGASDGPIERAELPTGIVTVLTKCYSASCDGPEACYAYSCPRKGLQQLPSMVDIIPAGSEREEWPKTVSAQVLASLTENEINRQTIIHKLVSKEEQYLQDLDIIESIFIKPLRSAIPPVMTPLILEDFIEEVFGNILELRDCNRRLLEVLYVRQREQYPIVQSIGDIFLDAATEFRTVYPTYVGHHPLAEKRMKEELECNMEFRLFIEKCYRQLSARQGGTPRLDLKHYLNRPGEHLQKYPVLLDAVYRETEHSNPDGDYVMEAIAAIQNLQGVAQLRTFQSAMGKGSTSKWEWHDLVSPELMMSFTQEEKKRQSVIFELIKGEMAYVRDLENIEIMYVRALRNAEPPIIPPDRLDQFLMDVFHNFNELHAHHRRLVDNLHEIQREEHPRIRSITAAIFDAALNFREAYMEYIPNYPIAAYRIGDEIAQNPDFNTFVNLAIRHPDAHRLDMINFINRPIPRLLRYELLLKEIISETPSWHEDRSAIPQVIEVIKTLGKETEPGVANSKLKVELWKYNSSLVFKDGEYVDMDLLNEQRSLIYTGKLLRQPDGGLNGWSELFVMLFDNYLVMTRPREKDGITKHQIYKRPIPLELLSLVNFTDASIHRNTSILRSFRGAPDTASMSSRSTDNDARIVYPCTVHHNGRLGGPYVLYAETSASRSQWKAHLDEALGLRKVVQESNKVFEIESLSVDTFVLPPITAGPNSPVWHDGTVLTGKVTCSIPFNTADGRGLVAVGCAEGVWIGYRHDSRSLRRVLHLKMVTQCALLDDFGLFLVLSDKVLFAYHLEALVPTTPGSVHASQTPQKINGKDIQFFSVGVLQGRTLVIYMKKKSNNECILHAVEPVIDKIQERPKATGGILPSLKRKTEWFRPYKEFSLSDAFDLVFLKAKIAVLCSKGFMIMDLTDYKTVMIPQRDDPRYPYLARRCDSCRPLGMFRSSDEEFLLCYDEFGIFVDKHGNPSRSIGTIEWEGKADRVAMHAPYVMLFDTRFIEIRHVETGRLAQIIPGNDIRCVWDGRTLDGGAANVPADPTEENMVQEPRVHAVMNMAEPAIQPGRPMRNITQHVFELFPTIPLYLPGSLASPSTVPFFPLSFSPPRSPA